MQFFETIDNTPKDLNFRIKKFLDASTTVERDKEINDLLKD
jgi:hypothetical protein